MLTHVVRLGTGTPTVVFESGMGDWSDAWTFVQPKIAEHTSTFSWDRPGLGRSDPADGEWTLDATTDLLHSLLPSPPYVLVGHSLGGLLMRRFAARWPDEVAAVVLVDPTSEHHQTTNITPRRLAGAKPAKQQQEMRPKFPGDVRAQMLELAARETYAVAVAREAASRERNIEEISSGVFPDVPLVVISSSGAELRGLGFDPEEIVNVLHDGHKRDAELSPQGRWVLADGSTHDVPHDAPDVIVAAILDVLR